MFNPLKSLLLSIGFYTRIPIPKFQKVEDKDLLWSLAFGPMAGILIGCILCLGFILAQRLHVSAFLTSTIILLLYIWSTGGIHFDGIGDTFDAAGSSQEGNKLIAIFKDPRLGSMGTLFLILFVAQYFYFFYQFVTSSIETYLVIWVFMISRVAPVILSKLLPYLESDTPTYRNHFLNRMAWKQVFLSIGIGVVFSFLFLGQSESFLFLLWVSSILTTAYGFCKIRFKAVNGDILGSSIVYCEVFLFHAILY